MYWWLSGWAGAFIARQGYYILTPQGCAPFMGQGEWDYWYDGKPPSVPLYCTDGFTSVLASKVLTGGSDNQRFSNVAVWNTAMPTYDYSIHKSYEFISS
jgi:putative spermidine/putrescine transport system substrate-binding protein